MQELQKKSGYIKFFVRFDRKCEEEIAKLEEKDKQLDNEMALPENATNVAKLQELTKEKESISARLEELYEKWETLEAL